MEQARSTILKGTGCCCFLGQRGVAPREANQGLHSRVNLCSCCTRAEPIHNHIHINAQGFDSPSFSFTPFSALQEANVTHIFFNATFWTADPEVGQVCVCARVLCCRHKPHLHAGRCKHKPHPRTSTHTLFLVSLSPPLTRAHTHNTTQHKTQAPLAEAMAVDRDSGRIVALGATDTLVSGAPTSVVRVDLRGGHVAPGFVDAHVHFLTGGLTLRQLDLRRVASKAEFVAAVRAAVQQGGSNGEAGGAGGEENGASSGGGSSRDSMLHGGWLLGYGWDESRFGGELPTSAWVDEGTSGGVPALLTRTDGHMALASTAALQAAGLWPAAPDLGECGEVGADAEGRPTGILTCACLGLRGLPRWVSHEIGVGRGMGSTNGLGGGRGACGANKISNNKQGPAAHAPPATFAPVLPCSPSAALHFLPQIPCPANSIWPWLAGMWQDLGLDEECGTGAKARGGGGVGECCACWASLCTASLSALVNHFCHLHPFPFTPPTHAHTHKPPCPCPAASRAPSRWSASTCRRGGWRTGSARLATPQSTRSPAVRAACACCEFPANRQLHAPNPAPMNKPHPNRPAPFAHPLRRDVRG